MNMETKKEIFERYKEEYFKAKTLKKDGRREQTRILDIVCGVIRMHRKSAVRKFNSIQDRDPCALEMRGCPVRYTPDVTAALKDVWDASNGLCGELLHPIIGEYVGIFTRDKSWKHSDEATGKLLAMSEMTVKRRVAKFEKVKRKGQGFSSTSPSFSPPLNTKGKVFCIYGKKSKKQEETPSRRREVLHRKDAETRKKLR